MYNTFGISLVRKCKGRLPVTREENLLLWNGSEEIFQRMLRMWRIYLMSTNIRASVQYNRMHNIGKGHFYNGFTIENKYVRINILMKLYL